MIVDAAVYADGRRLELPVEPEAIGEACTLAGTVAWVGLRMPAEDELARWCTAVGWCDVACDELVAPHSRAVLTVEEGLVHLVLRTAHYVDVRETVELGELIVLCSPKAMITARFGHATPLHGVRRALEDDPDALRSGTGAALAAVVAAAVEDFAVALDGFERDAAEVESEVFSDARKRPVQRLYRLKRELRRLLLAIGPLRDPLTRLRRLRALPLTTDALDTLLAAGEQLDRTINRAQSLSNLLDAALDASLAQISVQQNDDMRRISAWVAIAAGPTLLAGVYGMNFETFPELRWRFGYPLVLLVMLVLSVGLFRRFRRAGWL